MAENLRSSSSFAVHTVHPFFRPSSQLFMMMEMSDG